jgi:hypothetical protein
MRREVLEVVDAARSLQVQLAPTPANPACVRIGGDRSDFPARLYRLAEALQALDRVGSAALGTADETAPVDPAMDAARLRVALDGVFRWMRSTGLDVGEPHAIVREALGAARGEQKQAKGYRPVPKFAPNGFKKAMRSKPLLKLQVVPGEKVSLGSLAQKEVQAQMVDASLGPASTIARGVR